MTYVCWLGNGAIESHSDVPAASYALLGTAPIGLGLIWLPWFRRRGRLGIILPIAFSIFAALVALALAWQSQAASEW
jgi:hypothetical protein